MAVETGMRCARHSKEVTGVSCASCGTPICTKCMIPTPVGMKCRTCAKGKNTSLTQVRPGREALAAVTALMAGGVASVITHIGFLMIFVSIAFGYFAGSMILKASGMKRGLKMELITGIGMVVGGVAFKVLPGILLAGPIAKVHYTAITFGIGSLMDLWFWLGLGIATSCAVSKIRYM